MSEFLKLPSWLIAIYVVFFGLCVGSFLNVAILRGLSGENMVFDRSRCPKCKKQLKWYMNIPILSFIFLKGKCAYCKEPISIQYPLIEFITAVCFLVSYLVFGLTLKALFICIFLSLFILLASTDYKERVILDYHAYILFGTGLLYSALKLSDIDIAQSLTGALCTALLFEMFARVGILLVKQRIFGEGDTLIVLGLGSIFGFKNMFIIIVLSILIQCFASIPILIRKEFKNGKKKLALSYIIVIAGIIFTFLISYFNNYTNNLTYMICVVILSGFLFYALYNIVKDINEKKKQLTKNDEFDNSVYNLMPFGPALIYASTVCLFYLPVIKSLIFNFAY